MLTIIVVGGGLGGLSAAIGFAKSGHLVILFEGRDNFTEVSNVRSVSIHRLLNVIAWCRNPNAAKLYESHA